LLYKRKRECAELVAFETQEQKPCSVVIDARGEFIEPMIQYLKYVYIRCFWQYTNNES
jgi:hypothetical protein